MTVEHGRRQYGSSDIIGAPMDRVDGRLKVTGAATYTAEQPVEGLVYAALLGSAIARGRITRIDTSAAEAAPGVLGVMTHLNAPAFPNLTPFITGQGAANQAYMPLRDAVIYHAGQYIAVAVAETLEQAREAARLIHVEYETQPPRTEIAGRLDEAYPPQPFFGGILPDYQRGNLAQGFADAEVTIEQRYTTPIEHHNPMEPHAATAVWGPNGTLTVYDTSQGVFATRQGLAEALGMPMEKIRVICPFVGGGFGAKGGLWPYTVLTAAAAKMVGRPVKLALTRAQMYTSTGYRSETIQDLKIGARRDGALTAIAHRSVGIGVEVGEFPELAPSGTPSLYACPNVETSVRLVPTDLGTPFAMRAPGEAPGSFGLESALDELAYELKLDPIELRLRNDAPVDPESGMPWSSKALTECYRQGAERFGWAQRTPEPRSMRDGRWLVGMGMATASFPTVGFPAQATATIRADGSAIVRSATADLGTGQYTVMTQVAAAALGLPPERVMFQLGDTDQPMAFLAGGSSGVRSVGPAVRSAAEDARLKVLELATRDEDSPLGGYDPELIGAEDGELFVRHDPTRRESYTAILARHGVKEIAGEGAVEMAMAPNGRKVYAFGAQFVEVRVDPDFGLVRLTRALGAFDIGRVINQKTARSQGIGGMVFGIGMALLEHTSIHPTLGTVVSPDLAGYLLPVHADIPAIDAFFVDVDDPYVNTLGAKGVGEIGTTGIAAAIANAVYHATGRRVRSLPITPESLL